MKASILQMHNKTMKIRDQGRKSLAFSRNYSGSVRKAKMKRPIITSQ
jgi:hypothetical protein